jgi:hypothetical protein
LGTEADGGHAPYHYRWLRDDLGVIAYGQNYQPGTVIADELVAGGVYTYTREARDHECASWTLSVGEWVLTIYEEFDPGDITGDEIICFGGTPAEIVGTAATGGKAPYSYHWYRGTQLLDATGKDYTPGTDPVDVIEADNVYVYTREAIDSECATWTSSGTWTLTVNDSIPGAVIVGPDEMCAGSIASFTANPTNSAYTYEWDIESASTNNATIHVDPLTPGTITVTAESKCATDFILTVIITTDEGCIYKEAKKIVVVPKPTNLYFIITGDPKGIYGCEPPEPVFEAIDPCLGAPFTVTPNYTSVVNAQGDDIITWSASYTSDCNVTIDTAVVYTYVHFENKTVCA